MLLAEGFELGGEGACRFGGGEDGLLLFGLRDAVVELGDLFFKSGDAVFHLLQLDGIQALCGVLRRGCDGSERAFELVHGLPWLVV